MSRTAFIIALSSILFTLWIVGALYISYDRQLQDIPPPDQTVVVPEYDAAAKPLPPPTLPLDEICFKRRASIPQDRNT